METSLKPGFAQIFSCCPKNLSCPKFGGGAAAPLAPPVRTPMILRGGFAFYTPGGLCRKGRPWSKFCIIEDIVVSYTSKVEIHISRYFYMILRGVFVFGS